MPRPAGWVRTSRRLDLWVRKAGAKQTDDQKRTVDRWIAVVGSKPVREITRHDVEAFYTRNKLEMPDHPPAQVAMRNHLRAILNVALRAGWIDAQSCGGC